MRNLTTDMATEFASANVQPILMAEMLFDSGTLGVWTGYGTLVWGDKTFVGGGTLIGLSPIQETQDTQAKGLVCSLNGIPASLIALALLEKTRGRPFKLYLGAVSTTQYVATEDEPGALLLEDGSGYVLLESNLVETPYRLFSGLMDIFEFQDDGQTANLRLSVENILIIGQRNKVRRYTNEDQRKSYPNDRGLEYMNSLQDKEVVW